MPRFYTFLPSIETVVQGMKFYIAFLPAETVLVKSVRRSESNETTYKSVKVFGAGAALKGHIALLPTCGGVDDNETPW